MEEIYICLCIVVTHCIYMYMYIRNFRWVHLSPWVLSAAIGVTVWMMWAPRTGRNFRWLLQRSPGTDIVRQSLERKNQRQTSFPLGEAVLLLSTRVNHQHDGTLVACLISLSICCIGSDCSDGKPAIRQPQPLWVLLVEDQFWRHLLRMTLKPKD